jgi:hypothetical protein
MLVISFPGLPPEQFNNIGGTGNAFWGERRGGDRQRHR